jgi:hypothetical protein
LVLLPHFPSKIDALDTFISTMANVASNDPPASYTSEVAQLSRLANIQGLPGCAMTTAIGTPPNHCCTVTSQLLLIPNNRI